MLAGVEGTLAKASVLRNLRDGLIAVLAGNAVYFLLMPYLPARLQHRPFQQDLGLVIDFLVCFAFFGLARRFMRTR
jgi:hypothetical protein